MKQLEIRCRLGVIWLGILPETYSYKAADSLTGLVPDTVSSEIKEERCVCLKLTIHGWNHSTGVVGMHFVPRDSAQLDIRISMSSPNCTSPDSPVQIGLSKEYAHVVLKELLQRLDQDNRLGSGILTVSHGAYDPAYSNETIFRVLARCALLFLDPKWDDSTEDEIIAAVLEVIQER
jgi:hypothetical protein